MLQNETKICKKKFNCNCNNLMFTNLVKLNVILNLHSLTHTHTLFALLAKKNFKRCRLQRLRILSAVGYNARKSLAL